MVYSDDYTGRIPDDVRPETRDYYTYCMSHRDYGIDIYELNEHTFVSDLDRNEFQVETKPSCNFSRRVNDTDIRGVVIQKVCNGKGVGLGVEISSELSLLHNREGIVLGGEFAGYDITHRSDGKGGCGVSVVAPVFQFHIVNSFD